MRNRVPGVLHFWRLPALEVSLRFLGLPGLGLSFLRSTRVSSRSADMDMSDFAVSISPDKSGLGVDGVDFFWYFLHLAIFPVALV